MARSGWSDPARWRTWLPETDVEEVRAVVTDAIEAYDSAAVSAYEGPRGWLGHHRELIEPVRACLLGRDPEALLDACAHLLDVGGAGGIYETTPAPERAFAASLTELRHVMYVEPYQRRSEHNRAAGWTTASDQPRSW